MSFEEIKTLVTAIVASLGGITGIIAIINGIVRVLAAAKSAKATKSNTSTLTSVKDDIIAEIEQRMNCSLDVDISAKLNPVLNELIGGYKTTADALNNKLFAMKNLISEMAKMMATSRKITEDERLKLYALIDECGELVDKPVEAVKPKLCVSLQDTHPVPESKETSNIRPRVTV